MMIKDYAVTKRHHPGLCPDYESLTTRQAIEPHNRNRSRQRVIENFQKDRTKSLTTEKLQMNP